VVANKDITFSVRRGTVHAIVGENGAGKSTLMKILYGVQRPDEGTIKVNGELVHLHSPADAIAAGIGMVFQHFMLADNLTVLENTVLGAEKLHGIGDGARREIKRISDAYKLDVDPDALVADLRVGARQRIQILKVRFRGAKPPILDEPTAVLVPQEVDELFDQLAELKDEGLTVLFISHKLDEVLKVADTITVIRRGTTIDTVDPASVNARQLAELMVGSELASPTTEESTVTDTVLLKVENLVLGGGTGRPILDDISLTIHAGEVLGIAGVEGNGQAELVEVIMGMREPSSGRILLGDVDISEWQVREIREAGIGYIPEDRHRHGLLLEAPLWENVVLGHQTEAVNVSGPGGILVNASGAKRETQAVIDEYDVRTPSINVTSGSLSGGNQQKLIIGREMRRNPRVLVAAHPTRGVDVGAQAAIWDHIKAARRNGLGVLLVSADLEELVGLSDTIRVILRGKLSGEFDPDRVTREELGAAMTGAQSAPTDAPTDTPTDAPAAPVDDGQGTGHGPGTGDDAATGDGTHHEGETR
jgi:simple sugar transport system ATP-binding protein